MTKRFFNDIVMPNLLVIPMITHWLLPDSIEGRLYITFNDIVYYIPNICYVIYIINYLANNRNSISISIQKLTKLLSLLLFVYSLVHISYILGDDHIITIANVVISNFSFVYFPVLFLCFPLNRNQAEHTKWIVITANIILALEVILFSTGTLNYTSSAGNNLTDNLYEQGGIFRISTTVGAATGTGVVISVLGIIITSCYKINLKIKYLLIFLFTIAVFFTISRGSILLWGLYLLILFYYSFYKYFNYNKRILSIIIAISSLSILNSYGIFDPIKERTESLKYDDVTTGRDDRYQKAIKIFDESNYIGVGSGQVFPEKSIKKYVGKEYNMAPHNTYLTYLAEIGIIGLTLILILYLYTLFNIDYSLIISKMFPFILLLSYNTEGCIVTAEFLSLMFFYIMLTLIKTKKT